MDIRRRWTTVLWLLGAHLCSGCVPPQTDDLGSSQEAIVGGTETAEWPAIGAYLIDGGNSGICTATLVAPDVLLTAAHCADGAGELDTWTNAPNAWASSSDEWVAVREAVLHPLYEVGESWYAHDLAVLLLDEPVTDIEYIPVNTLDFDHTWTGRSLHYVGYGSDTTYQGPGAGIKRETDIPILDYYQEFFYGFAEGTNTCSGDSGGPALVELDGHLYVAGVLSWGWSWNESQDHCKYGGNASMRTDHELDFLAEFFDPYETPYPEGDDDTTEEDPGDGEDLEDDEGGCECRSDPRSPLAGSPAIALLIVFVTVVVHRRRGRSGVRR